MSPGISAPNGSREIAKVRATWHGVAGSAFLSVNDLIRARPFIAKALKITPGSAAASDAAGHRRRDRWRGLQPRRRRKPDDEEARNSERTRLLLSAEQLYRRALERRSGLRARADQARPRRVPVQEHEGSRAVASERERRGAGCRRTGISRRCSRARSCRSRRILPAPASSSSARSSIAPQSQSAHRRAGLRRADRRTARSRASAGARLPRDAELGRRLVGLQERHARSRRPEMAATAGPQMRRAADCRRRRLARRSAIIAPISSRLSRRASTSSASTCR